MRLQCLLASPMQAKLEGFKTAIRFFPIDTSATLSFSNLPGLTGV